MKIYSLERKQNIAMTGSLSVRGEVLPIGGVSSKVDAAIDAGIEAVLVPKSNLMDIVIDPKRLTKIKIIPVTNIINKNVIPIYISKLVDFLGILSKVPLF